MSQEKTYLVKQPTELLSFLLSLPGMSRKDAKNLLRFKTIAVPGVPAPRHDTPLRAGTEIRIATGKYTPAGTVLPSGIEILFEDESLIVINKPAGLLTIATESEKTRTAYHHLTSYVRDRSPKGDARVFIVHRLDRDTSGLLVFARTEELKFTIQRGWKSVTKKYQAIVEGELDPPSGTLRSTLIESDSLRVHSTRPEREDAKPAVTHYRTIRAGNDVSMVELILDTGRKNQIRVQLAEAGHPIVGDEKYGAVLDPARRLALHAFELDLRHPITGEALHFSSPLPDKLRGLVGKRDAPSRSPKNEKPLSPSERSETVQPDQRPRGKSRDRASAHHPPSQTAGRPPPSRRTDRTPAPETRRPPAPARREWAKDPRQDRPGPPKNKRRPR